MADLWRGLDRGRTGKKGRHAAHGSRSRIQVFRFLFGASISSSCLVGGKNWLGGIPGSPAWGFLAASKEQCDGFSEGRLVRSMDRPVRPTEAPTNGHSMYAMYAYIDPPGTTPTDRYICQSHGVFGMSINDCIVN